MISRSELMHFFATQFPQAQFQLEALGEDKVVLRKTITSADLRPGGTVAGPVLMALADAALYVAILHRIGLVALAVTTNLNINFLRKPVADKDIIAECRLIKLGKTLAVGEVTLFSAGVSGAVAHVTGTYSIPPERQAADL